MNELHGVVTKKSKLRYKTHDIGKGGKKEKKKRAARRAFPPISSRPSCSVIPWLVQR